MLLQKLAPSYCGEYTQLRLYGEGVSGWRFFLTLTQASDAEELSPHGDSLLLTLPPAFFFLLITIFSLVVWMSED